MELRQTRELTPAEADLVFASLRRLARKAERAGSYQNALAYLWYGFAGFLVLSVIQAVGRLLDSAPDMALQLAFAAITFVVVVILAQRQADKLARQPFRNAGSIGSRYVLRPDGIEVHGDDASIIFRWVAFQSVTHTDELAILADDGTASVVVVKSAFGGQDAELFSAELVRRWQATRTSA
jgi:hypothetical protein